VRTCTCATAMQHAIITDRAVIPAETRQKLDLIVGKYL
jgi:5'-methylthioadenosine phosphorylase